MEILANYPLKKLHSFGMNVSAHRFARFGTVEELQALLAQKKDRGDAALPLLILGGGSNLLFREDFPGWVLKNEIKGIEVLHEDADFVYVRAGAGENWHSFVQY
ncbi:MAG: FAD-binding protein [Flavihumibacter sp.]